MRRVWEEEINSHLLDCAEDQAIDLVEARKRFGDEQAIYHELKIIHPWLAAYADWIVIGTVLVACLPLYLGSIVLANTIPGLMAERLLVWWWGTVIALGSFVLLKWQWQIITPAKKSLILYALATGFVMSVALTVTLDINNFETTVYNSIFSIVLGIVLWLSWSRLSIHYKKLLLYVGVGLLIYFAWQEHAWFESALFPGCAYVQPDPYLLPPSQCVQFAWFNPVLLLVYSVLGISVGIVIQYGYRLWKQSSQWYRKIVTTSVFIMMPVTPFFISGVNQSGQLDALPWKRDIYQAYVDILGRRPEQKDYDFYEKTRSYQHMSEVRAVLYQSDERRLKIKLLAPEISEEQLDYYANSVMTIKEINDAL